MTTLKSMLLVLALLLFGLTVTGSAVELTNTPPPPLQQATPQTNQSSQLAAAELTAYNEMLQKQIETVQHYDDRLLSNIHWTLGTIGAIAALLVAFNWLSTFKTFKQEKQELMDKITTSFEEKQGALRNSIIKQLNDSTTAVNEKQVTFTNEINTKLNDTTRAVDEKFTQFTQKLSNDVTSNLTNLEAKFAALTEKTNTALVESRKQIESEFRAFVATSISAIEQQITVKFTSELRGETKAIRGSIDEIKLDLSNTRNVAYVTRYYFQRYCGKQSEDAKNFGLAYTYYMHALEAANSLDYDFFQTQTLDDLIRVLKLGASLTKSEREDAPKIAENVSPKLKDKTSEFLSLIAVARVIE